MHELADLLNRRFDAVMNRIDDMNRRMTERLVSLQKKVDQVAVDETKINTDFDSITQHLDQLDKNMAKLQTSLNNGNTAAAQAEADKIETKLAALRAALEADPNAQVPAVTGIGVSPTSLSLLVGQSAPLVVTDSNGLDITSDPGTSYSFSDSSVAQTVGHGEIDALAAGTSTLLVSAAGFSVSVSISVS